MDIATVPLQLCFWQHRYDTTRTQGLTPRFASVSLTERQAFGVQTSPRYGSSALLMVASALTIRRRLMPGRSTSHHLHVGQEVGSDPYGDDLTLKELALRFSEVRAHYRSNPTVSQAVVCQNMLRTRLDALHLCRVRVGPSVLHGNGVFATRDIAAEELITLYPGDALLYWADGDRRQLRDISVFFGSHVPQAARKPERVVSWSAREYEVSTSATTSIVGDPSLSTDPAYLAHLCNDGAAFLTSSGAERADYLRVSTKAMNAYFIGIEGCHFATIAHRPIKTGEEILVSYGEGYWLSRCTGEQDVQT